MAHYKQRQHIRFNEIPECLSDSDLIANISYPIRSDDEGIIYFGSKGQYKVNKDKYYTYFTIKPILDRGGGVA